jgi:hypothetical protein
MRRNRKPLPDAGVDGPLQADTAIAESLIAPLLPASHSDPEWCVREVARLAVQARLVGDIAGAVAAHRLLADVLGSTRGGYAAKHRDEPLDETEAEAVILEAAESIRAKRCRFLG